MLLVHNTILGNLSYDGNYCTPSYHHMRGNIVMGRADIGSGDCMTFSHNDVMGVLNIAPGDSVYANISADPYFCGQLSDNYTLAEDSPCVGTAHDGGDIGAFGIGCGPSTFVVEEEMSWGTIKHLFRK